MNYLTQISLFKQQQNQLLVFTGEPKERRKPFACLCPLCPPSSLSTGEIQWVKSLALSKALTSQIPQLNRTIQLVDRCDTSSAVKSLAQIKVSTITI